MQLKLKTLLKQTNQQQLKNIIAPNILAKNIIITTTWQKNN